MTDRLRFGIFSAPFHPHRQNPTLHYQTDLELVQRLVDLGIVPEDLAATVVRLGTLGPRPQGLIQPGKRLFGAPTMRCFHRLIQAIPISLDIIHCPSLEDEPGRPGSRMNQHSRTPHSISLSALVGRAA